MLRPRLRIPRLPGVLPSSRRAIHKLPVLQNVKYEEGIDNLFSPDGFRMAWTDHMTLMLDKLNAQISGTELEQQDLRSIIHSTAREPSKASIFNHASMAHNNHFFFRTLKSNPSPLPADLQTTLEHSFGSIDTLRREITATAMGMFGPGFVWLTTSSNRECAILATYLAGSPYPGAHWRRQTTDMNTLGARGSLAGYVGSKRTTLPPGGMDVVPLLCLNTWEHVWLRDYGLGTPDNEGKRAFIEAWWGAIDWDTVASTWRATTA